MQTIKEYILENVDSSSINEILKIYLSNDEYFILSGGTPATVDNIYQDMKESPPNILKEQKQYKIIKKDNQYIGVIDYITSYPDFDSVYIGLFIIDKTVQGCGHGSRILENFEAKIKDRGFKRIRLGVLNNNESGFKFWRNKGFVVIKEMYSTIHPERNWLIKVMEKDIE